MPLQFRTYAEQHYGEVLTLMDQVSSIDTPILLGDFNHGPASTRRGVSYEFPFFYGLITAHGFVSPYVLHDGRCTFCSDNIAVALSGFTLDVVIDHIYVLTESYKGRVLSAQVGIQMLSFTRYSSGSQSFEFCNWVGCEL